MRIKLIGLLLLLFFCGEQSRSQKLITYPAPQGIMYTQHNDDYTVKVRSIGGEWQDLFEYNVKVDLDKPQDASMVYFDHSAPVEISVRKNNGEFRSVKIRPSTLEILPTVQGVTAFFTLSKPSKISVEFDGDKLHNLHVFSNALETEHPDPNDPNVIYFGPGVHVPKDLPGDVFNIPSNKTVYLAGGAIVRAKLVCDRVSNVRIIGRGIIDQQQRGIEIINSDHITVDGITVVNPKHYTIYGGSSNHITINNLKSFSANGWSDGIDLMSCNDVVINDIFMRNSDDCIAIYGHRWGFYGNARNYSITNATLWADVAHPINIGLHGNTETVGDTLENMLFKNIDILEQDEDDPDYQGCIAITDGDFNLVRNIRFEDVRIDDFQEGKILSFRTVFNPKYSTGAGRSIQNIYVKNLSYNGSNLNQSIIDGIDKNHPVDGITFENLKINGKLILEEGKGNIKIGSNVKNIVFKKSENDTDVVSTEKTSLSQTLKTSIDIKK